MSDQQQLVLASTLLSNRLGVEKAAMIQTIKQQCFRNFHPDNVTDTQLAAFISTAQSLNLNPLLTGMIYAYPEKNGGITPLIGPDGVFTMLASHPEIEGWSSKHETIDGEPAVTCTIKHKRLGDISKTVFLSEWKLDNSPNWRQRPRHMLEIRALKQCARQLIHGVPLDEDEYKESIKNVTASAPDDAATTERPKAPARRGSARAAAEVVVEQTAALADTNSAPIESPSTALPPSDGPTNAQAAEPISAQPTKRAKAEIVVEAETEPAAPIPPTEPAVPEVAPGVGILSFHGKAWPFVTDLKIIGIDRCAVTPNKMAVVIFKAEIEGHDGPIDLVTAEHVALDANGVPQVGKMLTAGKQINAKIEAKLRAGKRTVAPAIWATAISEIQTEF